MRFNGADDAPGYAPTACRRVVALPACCAPGQPGQTGTAWGAEAFVAAHASTSQWFVSIGYAACHWATSWPTRASPEDPAIAALMNGLYVNDQRSIARGAARRRYRRLS
ncbi:MAG: DUF255 domain-containing protein [Myxococcales bacterium]|nr:DUF255 domain-containing protein [Myxococcales bacterium]